MEDFFLDIVYKNKMVRFRVVNPEAPLSTLMTNLTHAIGEDGKPFEGDHKNGCVTDYSNDNLEWVSKKENRRRSKVLKALRSIDVDPVQVPYNILDIFRKKKGSIIPSVATCLSRFLSSLTLKAFPLR